MRPARCYLAVVGLAAVLRLVVVRAAGLLAVRAAGLLAVRADDVRAAVLRAAVVLAVVRAGALAAVRAGRLAAVRAGVLAAVERLELAAAGFLAGVAVERSLSRSLSTVLWDFAAWVRTDLSADATSLYADLAFLPKPSRMEPRAFVASSSALSKRAVAASTSLRVIEPDPAFVAELRPLLRAGFFFAAGMCCSPFSI